MSSPFIRTETKSWGEERTLDVLAFATAIAPHLGATVVPSTEVIDREWRAVLQFPCGVQVVAMRVHGAGKGGHVELIPGPHGFELHRDEWPRHITFPKATVDTGRPLDKLAKDITRRVVEPSKPLVAELRGKADAIAGVEARMAATLAAFQAAHPKLRAEMNRDRRSAYVSSGEHREGFPSFTGQLAPNGALYLERVGGLEGSRLVSVLAALTIG